MESELRHQRPSDGLIIDVSPTDEDVAQPPSGTLLLVQRCAQVPLFEPPRVHKRLPEPEGVVWPSGYVGGSARALP